ncbi:MAG TPA: thioredoxin family protein [Ignavibacteriaceae bacterium]
MKTIITFFLLLTSHFLQAQTGYEITQDPENKQAKIYTGTVNKSMLQNDSLFNKWYTPNHNAYNPDTTIIGALARANAQKLQYVVFGGTWCEDTQFILPRFFKLQEMGGVPDNNITFFGVNRDKKALGHIAEAFGIINVPTIIVMKNGIELGRVVEYGKTGKWDAELATIVNGNK